MNLTLGISYTRGSSVRAANAPGTADVFVLSTGKLWEESCREQEVRGAAQLSPFQRQPQQGCMATGEPSPSSSVHCSY